MQLFSWNTPLTKPTVTSVEYVWGTDAGERKLVISHNAVERKKAACPSSRQHLLYSFAPAGAVAGASTELVISQLTFPLYLAFTTILVYGTKKEEVGGVKEWYVVMPVPSKTSTGLFCIY